MQSDLQSKLSKIIRNKFWNMQDLDFSKNWKNPFSICTLKLQNLD